MGSNASSWQGRRNVSENVEKSESLGTLGGNVNWYSHCEKQYVDYSKN